MFRIAICDDDAGYIAELKRMIAKCEKDSRKIQFFEFLSGEELLMGDIHEMDVIFLDIRLEGMNGNQTSVCLKERGYRGLLIHCSGIYMPTPETVKISPYRYLLKQMPEPEMLRELNEILREMKARQRCSEIEGSYMRERMMFRIADIVYITHHANKNSVLHLCRNKLKQYMEGNIIVSYGFDELLRMLEPVDFALPHNSYMINLHYVSKFDFKKEIVEVEGKMIPISRGQKDRFFHELTEYTRKKTRENEAQHSLL
jgi:DNA-binding LytR/AlgR family response regulator